MIHPVWEKAELAVGPEDLSKYGESFGPGNHSTYSNVGRFNERTKNEQLLVWVIT